MSTSSNWFSATVNPEAEHFAIYTVQEQGGETTGKLVARVGYWRWMDGGFPVQFVMSGCEQTEQAKDSLDYYLNKLPNLRKEWADRDFARIWMYQKYHCGTGANVYSKVRWRFLSQIEHQTSVEPTVVSPKPVPTFYRQIRVATSVALRNWAVLLLVSCIGLYQLLGIPQNLTTALLSFVIDLGALRAILHLGETCRSRWLDTLYGVLTVVLFASLLLHLVLVLHYI